MRICSSCGDAVEDDWACCMNCGHDLGNKKEWNERIEEANNLHWLAQAQRRLEWPIELSDEIPFLAVEYSWKVVNRLYNFIPSEKVLNSDSGKYRDESAIERIMKLLKALCICFR